MTCHTVFCIFGVYGIGRSLEFWILDFDLDVEVVVAYVTGFIMIKSGADPRTLQQQALDMVQ